MVSFVFDELILYCLPPQIQVFRWEVPSEALASPELRAECGHHGHTLALHLKARGSMIALGDLMQSITVINYDEAKRKLEEEARDFSCNYMRAIEILTDSVFVGAEDHENIFLVEKEPEGGDKTGRLLHFGEFHVGDFINVFRHGTLSNHPMEQPQHEAGDEAPIPSLPSMSESGSAAMPKGDGKPLVHFEGSLGQSVLFGTVSGAIGTLLLIDEASYTFLKAVEVGMQTALHSVGGLSHKDWRSFSNDRKCGDQVNVVDGDLVERFLELPAADMARVVQAVNNELSMNTSYAVADSAPRSSALTVEECCARIEEISQCH
jgi:DNA damage-binding protein 1